MDADGLIKAGSAGERPLADAMEVVDALRRSGVGGMFLVDHLEEYVKFPEKRAGLRAGGCSHCGQVSVEGEGIAVGLRVAPTTAAPALDNNL